MDVAAVSAMGMANLILLLGMGGGAGLPLGLPPGPEDPLLATVAPDECLFYTTWAGMAEPDAASGNRTEQLLAEPEIRQLIAEIERRITEGLINTARENEPEAVPLVRDAVGWVKTLLTHPTMIYVGSVTPPRGDTPPEVRAGALVRIGDNAAAVKAQLERYQATFLREQAEAVQIGGVTWYRLTLADDAPPITWGVRGKYLIVGVGDGEAEAIMARATTPVPKWLSDLKAQLPVERRATVTYINVGTIIDTFVPMIDEPQFTAFFQASGLGDIRSLASVTGLDDEGFVSKTLLGLGGSGRGLMQFADAKPLTPDELAPIPADATLAFAARIDAEEIFDTLLTLAGTVEPRARRDFEEGIAQMEQGLGFNLRNDVLGALGDAWCVYNSPGEGGLVITGLTVVIPVKDRASLAAVEQKLVAMAKARLEMDEMPDDDGPRYYRRRPNPRIEQFRFAGQDVCFFNAQMPEFPLAPAWCLTDDALIVSTFPQNIKAYLSRGADFRSLATVPEVAAQFTNAGGPLAITYSDSKALFELIYPFVPMMAQSAFSAMAGEGIDLGLDVSLLPSAPAIGKHLRPAVTVLRRNAAGVELDSRQTLPGGSIGTTLPVAAGLMIPAIIRVRESARRVASMNNMRQIGLSLQEHEMRHGAFPPAYTADKDGKPLLSWRVAILPYIEESNLHEKFRMDEPWDSEHNKQFLKSMPSTFMSPSSSAGPGMTNYLTIRGKDTAFPGAKATSAAQIRDGMSHTIMLVEASDAKAVPWTKPDDFEYDEENPAAGLTGVRHGGFIALFCDGSSHFISQYVDADILKLLFTANDGQPVDVWDLDGRGDSGPIRTMRAPETRRDDFPELDIEPTIEELEELPLEELELDELDPDELDPPKTELLVPRDADRKAQPEAILPRG